MLLADDLGERPWPQQVGERGVRGRFLRRLGRKLLIGEQIGHGSENKPAAGICTFGLA